jgi:uncharacterized protein (DUF2461 family)
MATKRRKITRPPRRTFSAKAIALFKQMKRLETQCTYAVSAHGDGCHACEAWWEAHGELHRELELKPWQWLAIENPNVPNTGQSQDQQWYEQAQQLYRNLASQEKGQAT